MTRLSVIFISAILFLAVLTSYVFAATVEIQIADFSFQPKTKTIAVGDTVKWINSGQIAHTSTSGTGCVSDGIWDSGTLSSGQSFSQTFSTAGTFKYFCTFHCASAGMTGTIVVGAAGTGNPKISVKPAAVNLGTVKIGSASSPKNITISNSGTSDLSVSSLSITGTSAGEFSQTNDCSTVASGSTCTVTVTLTATSAGNKSAILNIASNDPKKPSINVKLSGKAAPAAISVKPASVNFGSVKTGSASNPKIITVKNTGTSDLSISSVSISGTNADEFSQTNDCTTVVSKSTCSVNVTLTATATGTKSAILNIASNDPKKSTLKVKLAGKATAAAMPALRPASQLHFTGSPVTKEDMAAFLVLVTEGEVEDGYCSGGSPFVDVSPDSWSCKYIKRLNELGLATACETDKFCPEALATGDMLEDFLLQQ